MAYVDFCSWHARVHGLYMRMASNGSKAVSILRENDFAQETLQSHKAKS